MKPLEANAMSKELVKEATGGGVEEVCEHDVYVVFGTDWANTEHGEAELHVQDMVGWERKLSVVDG